MVDINRMNLSLRFHEFGYDRLILGLSWQAQARLSLCDDNQHIEAFDHAKMPDLGMYAAHLAFRTRRLTSFTLKGIDVVVDPLDEGQALAWQDILPAQDARYDSVEGMGRITDDEKLAIRVLEAVAYTIYALEVEIAYLA